MADYHLIVSNPPHRTPDVTAIAPQLGCSAAEARMKLNFPAPDIWLVEVEKAAARDAVEELFAAGANVAWIPGSVLAAVPGVTIGSAISIDVNRVILGTNDGEVEVTSENRPVAVLVEPAQQESRRASGYKSMLTQDVSGRGPVKSMPFVSNVATGVAGVAGFKAIDRLDKLAADAKNDAGKRLSDVKSAQGAELYLDVYTHTGGGWKAIRLAPLGTDFTGLGDLKGPTARANIRAIVEVLKQQCGARVDERLKKVTYKPAIVRGLALKEVLGSISRSLGALPQLEVASRLAFLTTKG